MLHKNKSCVVGGHYNFDYHFLVKQKLKISTISRYDLWIRSYCDHNHKKRKDSLETRAVLLIFLLELEMSKVTVQSIHQNSKKWQLLPGTDQ